MTYLDYIYLFEGIDLPCGELATRIKADMDQAPDPVSLSRLYEKAPMAEQAYMEAEEHLTEIGASKAELRAFYYSIPGYQQAVHGTMADLMPLLALHEQARLIKALEPLQDISQWLKSITLSGNQGKWLKVVGDIN